MALFFHEKKELFPFALLACVGLVLIYSFYRVGFYFSLVALFFVTALQRQIWMGKPLYLLFLAAITLSWVIALLSYEEISEWLDQSRQKKGDIDSFSHLPKICEKGESAQDLLLTQYKKTPPSKGCTQFETMIVKQNPSSDPFQEKEEDLDSFLQLQLLKTKYQDLEALFEQKKEQLLCARVELFQMEGELFVLQKEQMESSLLDEQMGISQKHFQEILTLYQELDAEVKIQEEIISSFVFKKKTAKPRNSKTLSEKIKKKQYSLLE